MTQSVSWSSFFFIKQISSCSTTVCWKDCTFPLEKFPLRVRQKSVVHVCMCGSHSGLCSVSSICVCFDPSTVSFDLLSVSAFMTWAQLACCPRDPLECPTQCLWITWYGFRGWLVWEGTVPSLDRLWVHFQILLGVFSQAWVVSMSAVLTRNLMLGEGPRRSPERSLCSGDLLGVASSSLPTPQGPTRSLQPFPWVSWVVLGPASLIPPLR